METIGDDAFPQVSETLYIGCTSYARSWAKDHNYPSDGAYHYVIMHDWDKPTYVWAADNSAVTAEHICKRDAGHKQSEIAPVTWTLTKSPTETVSGERLYRAAFDDAAFTAQSKTLSDVPALSTLSGLRLPASLTAIGDEAFAGGAFQYVIVPQTCTSIGQRAFAGCDSLIYIKVPASVTNVVSDAFDGCPGGLIVDRLG